MKLHPDKSSELEKNEYMMITKAYRVLGKEDDKEKYDEGELDKENLIKIGDTKFDMSKFVAYVLL